MNLVERKRLARDLSGPAASVLMALLLASRPLTAVSLAEDWVNQSVPTVQSGLNRLAEYGLVTNFGKFNGWSVNLNQLALWQGHSGVFLEEEGDQSQAHPRLTSSSPETAVVDSSVDKSLAGSVEDGEKMKVFSFVPSDHDQIRSDQDQLSNSEKNQISSDLAVVVKNLGIRRPSDKLILERRPEVDAAELVGWYLWGVCQEWVSSALGWAIKCVLNPKRPLEDDWLALADWWLGVDEETAVVVLDAFDGALMVRSVAAVESLMWSHEVDVDTAVCNCLTALWLGKQLGELAKVRGL